MATLTIRNLPENVHDQLRRAAAENMEEEVRQTLKERYSRRLSTEEIVWRLDQLNADETRRTQARKMLASESLIAGRRIEALYDHGLISREEKISWDGRIARGLVSLETIQQFATGKR